MKYLKNGAFCVLLSLCCLCSTAQKDQFRPPVNEPDYHKPRLFADLPERMDLSISVMATLLDMPLGTSIATRATNKFPFNGTVVSRAQDKTAKSVVVRLSNRYGATLTFTRINNADGTLSYLGRIISLKHGDAYDIVQEAGQLILQKKGLYDLISE